MQCPKCQFENTERAKTCARCGTVLDRSGSQPQAPARKRGRTCSVTGCVVAALLMILLVVIAFPILNRMRPKARATSCLSNVKQLQLGMLMYAQDYNEVFPPAGKWCDVTMPYTKNTQIYVCPQASGGVGSYAMNDGLSGRELSAIVSPAQTVSLFDSTPGWNVYGGSSLIVNRHNGGANFGFADGHAKWMAPGSTSSCTWTVTPPPAPASPLPSGDSP